MIINAENLQIKNVEKHKDDDDVTNLILLQPLLDTFTNSANRRVAKIPMVSANSYR
jgi:hypothetical protein